MITEALYEKKLAMELAGQRLTEAAEAAKTTKNGTTEKTQDTTEAAAENKADSMAKATTQLPSLLCLGGVLGKNLPSPPPALIEGVLRRGHKLLLSGASKSGKSLLLMELAIALAGGTEWLGFKCKKSRVLYVNLEIEGASCIHRFQDIYDAKHIPLDTAKNIIFWNMRGQAKPLDKLVPELIDVVQKEKCEAVIVDPIYKVITGDENSASDMAFFCNQFDKLAAATNASIIYSHHHSKHADAKYDTGNRLSGSGVFTRDVDALLDILQLKWESEHGETAWRVDNILREFKNISPINIWFDYPVHIVDKVGELDKAEYERGASAAKKKQKSQQDKKKMLDDAFDSCKGKGTVRVSDMARELGCSEKTVRRYISEFKDKYFVNNSIVARVGEFNDGEPPF